MVVVAAAGVEVRICFVYKVGRWKLERVTVPVMLTGFLEAVEGCEERKV